MIQYKTIYNNRKHIDYFFIFCAFHKLVPIKKMFDFFWNNFDTEKNICLNTYEKAVKDKNKDFLETISDKKDEFLSFFNVFNPLFKIDTAIRDEVIYFLINTEFLNDLYPKSSFIVDNINKEKLYKIYDTCNFYDFGRLFKNYTEPDFLLLIQLQNNSIFSSFFIERLLQDKQNFCISPYTYFIKNYNSYITEINLIKQMCEIFKEYDAHYSSFLFSKRTEPFNILVHEELGNKLKEDEEKLFLISNNVKYIKKFKDIKINDFKQIKNLNKLLIDELSSIIPLNISFKIGKYFFTQNGIPVYNEHKIIDFCEQNKSHTINKKGESYDRTYKQRDS